jgi:hypothetical protein
MCSVYILYVFVYKIKTKVCSTKTFIKGVSLMCLQNPSAEFQMSANEN